MVSAAPEQFDPTMLIPEFQMIMGCDAKDSSLAPNSSSQLESEPAKAYQRLKVEPEGAPVGHHVAVHRDLLDWMEDHVQNDDVRHELTLCFQTYMREGQFLINQKRFGHGFGGTATKALRTALGKCPFVERLSEGIPGVCSSEYRFRLRAISRNLRGKTWSPDNGILLFSVPPGYCRLVRVPSDWMAHRASRWVQFCAKRGLPLPADLRADSPLASATFDAIRRICVPAVVDATGVVCAEKISFLLEFHKSLLTKRVRRKYCAKDGRTYHAITNCPRVLRRQLLLNGEPLREADLSCSHFYLLATQIADVDERDRLLELIRSGRFYETVAELSGEEFVDRAELKQEMQRQCLFGRDGRISSRPLWPALRKVSRQLCSLILRLRRGFAKKNASNFAKLIQRLEGRLMDDAHYKLIEEGIDGIRLHDGFLVAESSIDRVAQIIRDAGVKVFGAEPRIGIKTGD